MFSKASIGRGARGQAAHHRETEGEEPSVIGDAAMVVGNLTCEGEIEVQGKVEGNIHSRTVTVGERGLVEGEIVAESVCIRGSVKGSVVATSVSVTRTARVIGNITHKELSIEPGAHLEGRRPWRLRPLEDRENA